MRGARARFVVLFALAGGLSCTYSPNPASGTLKCSATTPKQCPQGYTCDEVTDYCLKNGAGTDGGVSCSGTCTIKITGTLTNANAPATDSKFVGHWVFSAGSTETVSCSDGSIKDNDLTGDFADFTLTSGTLVGSYFCDWNLTAGPAGAATVIRAGQSCTRNVTDATTGVTKFTWHGTTFTFATLDSRTGTLMSTIGVDYIDDASKTGCTP